MTQWRSPTCDQAPPDAAIHLWRLSNRTQTGRALRAEKFGVSTARAAVPSTMPAIYDWKVLTRVVIPLLQDEPCIRFKLL